VSLCLFFFFFSSRRRHTRWNCDWSSDVCSSDLPAELALTFSAAIATDEGASEVAVTDAAGASLVDGVPTAQDNVLTQPLTGEARSEERRVGKECRCRGWR